MSTDEDKVNLIMDSNIRRNGTPIKEIDETINYLAGDEFYEHAGDVEWYEIDQDNSFGPTTAMAYLNEATSDWSNIPNLNETYIDEGGCYGTISFTGKARLPKMSEIPSNAIIPLWYLNYLAGGGSYLFS